MDELTELLAELLAEEKIRLACDVLGKDVNDYSHLDRGRQAMTGGNLLRNAIKKNGDILSLALPAARAIIASRPSDFKRESSGKRTGSSPRPLASPRTDAEWKTTDADLDRWERAYKEDVQLRAEGKLPPRRIIAVATPDEVMLFGPDGNIKYHTKKRCPNVNRVTRITSR